jgi:hypothetical protein
LWAVHFDTQYSKNRNAYFIPFTGDAKGSLKGKIDGYIDLNSSGHKLQIKPGRAAISATQTIYMSNENSSAVTLNAGMYCFEFKGERSERMVWNSTVDVMASTLNGLSTMRNYPGGALTGVFDSPLNAPSDGGLSLTLTLSAGFDVKEEVRVISYGLQTATATEKLHLMTLNRRSADFSTVQGRSGFVSGTYDVHAYAMVYRDTHNQKGKLVTELV